MNSGEPAQGMRKVEGTAIEEVAIGNGTRPVQRRRVGERLPLPPFFASTPSRSEPLSRLIGDYALNLTSVLLDDKTNNS
jgi:hypothetical protein